VSHAPAPLPQPEFGDAIYDKKLEKPSSFILIIIIPYIHCFPKGFLELANNPPYQRKWFIIEGTKPVEEVFTEIWSIVQERLG